MISTTIQVSTIGHIEPNRRLIAKTSYTCSLQSSLIALWNTQRQYHQLQLPLPRLLTPQFTHCSPFHQAKNRREASSCNKHNKETPRKNYNADENCKSRQVARTLSHLPTALHWSQNLQSSTPCQGLPKGEAILNRLRPLSRQLVLQRPRRGALPRRAVTVVASVVVPPRKGVA